MSFDTPFTKKTKHVLKELAKGFRKLNGAVIPAEIILIDGASILANYGFREMVYDMSKRSLVFFLSLCMVLFTVSCTSKSVIEPANSEEPNFNLSDLPELNIEPDVKEGVTKGETENSSYEFYGRTEEDNINLASINEIAVWVLRNEYGYSPPKGRIVHFIDENEKGIWVREVSLEVEKMVASNGRTVINPDLIDSVGALFYGSSRNLLPAWLATGLELYWSDKFGIERLSFDKNFDVHAWQTEMEIRKYPAFGDFWFRFNKSKEILPVAFSFVKWLDENELLNEIVITYLDDDQDKGDLLFADAWLKLTGYDIREDFFFENRLRYLYGNYLQTISSDLTILEFAGFTFSALTEHGYYLFDRWLWEYHDYKNMIECISVIDAQYVYAKQWLGFEYTTPIPTRILFDRINGTASVGAEYVIIPGNDIVSAVHEAVHHLLSTKNVQADFISLTEGLSMALMYIYASQDPDGYGALLSRIFAADGEFDFKQYAHSRALKDVNYLIENDRYGTALRAYGVRAEDKPSKFPQGLLNTYETSASFVIFLLEIGSKEDFMQLYTDISLAEELYGKDFNALYEQWLNFLTQT